MRIWLAACNNITTEDGQWREQLEVNMRHGMVIDSVACEYAKCKNRPYIPTVERHRCGDDSSSSRVKKHGGHDGYQVAGEQDEQMNDKASETTAPAPDAAPEPKKVLSPAAQRALAEAEARRAAAAAPAPAAREFQGPEGPEPTRFGDWERNGIASDF